MFVCLMCVFKYMRSVKFPRLYAKLYRNINVNYILYKRKYCENSLHSVNKELMLRRM